MKKIGIKLADGSFYPILTEGEPDKKQINLTTAKDDQTTVHVDLYRSENESMENAEYVDTLQITHMVKHPNGEPDLSLDISLDENNHLSAELHDPESGGESSTTVTLMSKTKEELEGVSEVAAAAVGAGLLGAAMAKKADDDKTLVDDADETKAATGDDTISDDSLNVDDIFENTDMDASEEIPVDFDVSEISDEPVSDEAVVEDNAFADDSTTTEETDVKPADETVSDETVVDDGTIKEDDSSIDDIFANTDFDLPEDDGTAKEEDTSTDNIFADTDFDLPEDDGTTKEEDSSNEDIFAGTEFDTNDNSSNEGAAGGSAIDFSDLYDKETEEGLSTEDEIKKKTKIPVIVCVICACICILAVLLILFVIPCPLNVVSKISDSKNKTETVEVVEKEEPVQEAPVAVVEPETTAKENEIVVVTEPETVPVVPEVTVVPEEKKEDVRYKIKWGDTLWDISDSYYKNPWRYKRIAKYNNIKDPDYIISGTYIEIPQE